MLDVLYVIERAERNRLLNALADSLHPTKVRYSVVVMGAAGPLIEDMRERGIPVRMLDVGATKQMGRGTVQLARLLASQHWSLVHSNGYRPGVLVETSRRLQRRRIPSVLGRHHNLEHHIRGHHVHARIDALTARAATHVAAVSEAVRSTLVEREGVPATRITVVPNGVDWAALTPSEEAVAGWRARYRGRALVVAVGRLDPIKDYGTVLRTIASVRRSVPNVVLVIAGTGPERVRLESHAASLQLGDAAEFLGWVPDIQNLLAAADVVIQASLDESFGQVILEAMGLGVPVATTTPGGVREIVHPWYPDIEPGDVEALAALVVDSVTKSSEARRRATEAAADVRVRLSAAAMAGRQLDVYERVAAP